MVEEEEGFEAVNRSVSVYYLVCDVHPNQNDRQELFSSAVSKLTASGRPLRHPPAPILQEMRRCMNTTQPIS